MFFWLRSGRPGRGACSRSLGFLVALQIPHELPIHAVEGRACTDEHADRNEVRGSESLVGPVADAESDEQRDRELKSGPGVSGGAASLAPHSVIGQRWRRGGRHFL